MSKAKSTRTTRSTRSTRSTKKSEDIRKLLQKTEENDKTEIGATIIDGNSLPTAACDDHEGSSPATPSKRPTREEKVVKEKRSRKTVRRDLLKEGGTWKSLAQHRNDLEFAFLCSKKHVSKRFH